MGDTGVDCSMRAGRVGWVDDGGSAINRRL